MASIITTEDIQEEVVEQLTVDLKGILPIEDSERYMMRSTDPPSWICLLFGVPIWYANLGPSVDTFLHRLANDAAGDIWQEIWANKDKISAALKDAVPPLRRVVTALRKARERSKPSTSIDIGIPHPDPKNLNYIQLPLRCASEEETALSLAVFVDRMPKIDALLHQEFENNKGFVGTVYIEIKENGVVVISWNDRVTQKLEERKLEE